MRKDSVWHGEYGEYNKIHEKDLKMPAIDTKRVLIIEQKRRSGHEKI